jgi:hypothetical protein
VWRAVDKERERARESEERVKGKWKEREGGTMHGGQEVRRSGDQEAARDSERWFQK